MTFMYEGVTISKPLHTKVMGKESEHLEIREGRMKLLPRSETIVRFPVESKSNLTEDVLERREIVPGVYVARSLVKIVKGYALTSVLNTTEEEVELGEPTVQVMELENAGSIPEGSESPIRNRYEEVLSKLRVAHLSKEERSLEEICFEYQGVFFLPGDRLSCTGTAKHTIHLEPGTVPTNTCPYRLPESQKAEVDRQVSNLLKEGIIEESTSHGIA
jgi:hypothetical protein